MRAEHLSIQRRTGSRSSTVRRGVQPGLGMNPDLRSMLMDLLRLQLRSVRGQLASSVSACSVAEARNRQLSSQVSSKIAELAQMREEAEKAASNYKAVCMLHAHVYR